LLNIVREQKGSPINIKAAVKKLAVDFGIRVGYGTAFLLLLVSYLLTQYNNSELLKEAKLVEHTNKIIVDLEGLMSSIKDAETGIRGFIIMKDPLFLSPYKKSKPLVDSLMGRIRKETQDSPQERYRLNALDQLISGKFDELSFLLGLYPKNNYELSDTLKARAWLGNKQMDRIRVLVFQFQSAEQSLLKQRSKELSARIPG
jgi:CHASE3 domain sensor protein